jgi:hypothetical protein
MTAARAVWTVWLRRVPVAAAMLALALQLMFPAGFMAADPGQAHGLPIVICTAQGQVSVNWDGAVAADSGAHKSKVPGQSMAGCPFAGHAAASAPPAPAIIATPVAFAAYLAPARAYAVFPGRGLAAPPPPAIGPPVSI